MPKTLRKKQPDTDDLVSAIGLLVRRMRAEHVERELSWPESMIMSRLARGGAATVAELARAEGVKPQSMGTTIASLEKAGHVQRNPHPTDGRQWLAELTPKGVAFRDAVRSAKQAWLERAIAELTADERATLFAAGDIIKKLAES